jgi:hypothetical protein
MSDGSASRLIADALDLRHRPSRIWKAAREGRAPAYQARHLAAATRDLSFDEAVAGGVHGGAEGLAARVVLPSLGQENQFLRRHIGPSRGVGGPTDPHRQPGQPVDPARPAPRRVGVGLVLTR